MYVERIGLMSEVGAHAALAEAVADEGALRKEAGGFLGQALLRSFAYPEDYTLMAAWESIEAAWAFSDSPSLADLHDEVPPPVSLSPTRLEGYDIVINEPGDASKTATCTLMADWELSSIGKARDYEESRSTLFALQKEHLPGFVSARLLRSAGVPTKYIMAIRYTARDGNRGGAPELASFLAEHPAAKYANDPPRIEMHAIVHQL